MLQGLWWMFFWWTMMCLFAVVSKRHLPSSNLP
jgi:hypothetical protein